MDMELRWIKRNGEKVLQYLIVSPFVEEDTWKDVPTVD